MLAGKKTQILKFSLLFIVLLIFLSSCKSEPGKKSLEKRFTAYLHALDSKNLDKIIDLSYPKLHTIKERKEVEQLMLGPLNYRQPDIRFDSIRKDSIYPIVKVEKGYYSIATFLMSMSFASDSVVETYPRNQRARDSALLDHVIGSEHYPAPKATLKALLLANEFGVEMIDFKESPERTIMYVRVAAIAVKDKFAKEWTFVTGGNDQELFNSLFSVGVLKKLSSFNKEP
jgi:hypothetical protein